MEQKTRLQPVTEDNGKDLQKRLKAGESLLIGGLKAPEPYKEEAEDGANTIRLVFGTSGEYPDGTKWTRDATPEEEAKYKSWAN